MCELSDDMDVLVNHQFTIELVCDSDDVRIRDGNGRKGGNARGRGNVFKIRWTNDTRKLCRLTFYQWIVDEHGEFGEVGLWPFAEPAQPDNESGNELDIAAQGNGNNPGVRQVTLKTFGERVVIKYDVVVNPDDPVADLDPMIVVER